MKEEPPTKEMEALRKIKLTCLTATDGRLGLAHITRLCIDAGVTAKLDELQAMERGALEVAEAARDNALAELAYVRLQRDVLLNLTWLDLPDEPSESTARWREEFAKGWERKAAGPAVAEGSADENRGTNEGEAPNEKLCDGAEKRPSSVCH